jgi:hypothetical protein
MTTAVRWPAEIGENVWCFSPELISLFGTELYDELTELEQKRLSFYEAVNFFSLNINGERALLEGISERLYRKAHSPYLHNFLEDENKHMQCFAKFCRQYAGKIYSDRKMKFKRHFEPGEEDFLFFTKVMIFEEIVDTFNSSMATDRRLSDVVREINDMHHCDEVKHLAFGRLKVLQLFGEHCHHWSAETLHGIRQHLEGYMVSLWREYYNPDIYSDIGLPDPYSVAQYAWASDSARDLRRRLSAPVLTFLLENQILLQEPAL